MATTRNDCPQQQLDRCQRYDRELVVGESRYETRIAF